MDAIARLIATFLGAGRFPLAPATFASAIVAGILFALGPGPGGRGHLLAEAIVILALLPISYVYFKHAERTMADVV